MIGLNFAPALGAAGGAALKKLNGPDFLKLGGCFVAGTKVHLSASPAVVTELELAYAATASDSFSYDLGFAWEEPRAESALVVPIEQVPLGSRIATKNPEAFGAENPIPDAHESTWRLLSAEIEREDGARVEVELLRPLAWIEEQGFTPGACINLRLEELNVAGLTTIRSVDRCPPLSDGHGNLVTGRFVTRGATNLVEATFSDSTVLNGTSIHPVWSLDRMDWVPLGELAIGERVYSNDAPLHLVERVSHNQPTDVYNIEVDCEHVYQVGDAGILVHNQYHHLVSHYSNAKRGWTQNWSADARQILSNANVKMHGRHNLRFVAGHTGPHPELYHQRVFERLQQAVRGLTASSPAYQKAVLQELDDIFVKLAADPINALKGIGL